MQPDIINGDIVGTKEEEGKNYILYTDKAGKGHTVLTNIYLQSDIDYAGMFYQLRIEKTPMHYTFREWISAEHL